MRIITGLKKLVICVFAGILCIIPAGCAKDETKLSLYVPDGAPLVAARGFFADGGSVAGYRIEANLTTGAAIAPLISAKTPDIAVAPVTVCSQSYNLTGGEYVFAGTAVFGLNHIVTNLPSAPDTLSGLIGEVIYSFQKQGTPSQTLRATLMAYSVPYKELTESDKAVAADKVNIEYLPAPADIRNAMTGPNASSYRYGLLAEPMVTAVTGSGVLSRAFDLQELWKVKHGASYPQAAVIVRKSLLVSDPELIEKLTAAFGNNFDYITAHADEAAAYLKDELDSAELPSKDIVSAFIKSAQGQEAFAFLSGAGKKDSINAYLAAIGQALPDDLFYV